MVKRKVGRPRGGKAPEEVRAYWRQKAKEAYDLQKQVEKDVKKIINTPSGKKPKRRRRR